MRGSSTTPLRFVLACAWCLLGCGLASAQAPPAGAWPAITRTAKPWTRWWWPGSAVDREGLSGELTALAAAGVGGVEVTPIYGARGSESRYIDFLSPRWVEMLAYTSDEAHRLDLGVDMATGTGWPFGGPWVSAEDASSSLQFVDGQLSGKPTAMKVKRAAPGDEGLVLDPYSPAAMQRYLEPFSRALAPLPRDALRAQFHDSFEYYNASWTPGLPAAFRALNGYDLAPYGAALAGAEPADAELLGRIKGDYRRTLAKLHLDYLESWAAWAHSHGFLVRNQAHGAPGNLLDLYAVADIPETESYGMTRLPIAGLRDDPLGVNVDPDPPLNLVGRFASSAAHVAGRPLASSESLTWLRENFRESPAAAKPQLDRLFIAGINHVFYHGAVYSPPDAPWPGWFFYAASQINPRSPLWEHWAAMNAYVARVQSLLQTGRPDNELLVFWPFDDLVDDPQGLMRQLSVHDNGWLADSSTARLALSLLANGYSFDFVSDAQLQRMRVGKRRLIAPGGSYRAVLVPALRRMSVDTLGRLRDFAVAGVPVLFEGLPQDVPGQGDLAARRERLAALRNDPALMRALARPDIPGALAKLDLRREGAGAAGLGFVRRARANGFDYFFANLGAQEFDGWLELGTAAKSAWLLDARTGEAGVAATRAGRRARCRCAEVYLQIASGDSLLLRTWTTPIATGNGLHAWRYVEPKGGGIALDGPWSLEFLGGGPALPAATTLEHLSGWTDRGDAAADRFAGTARYRLDFEAPALHADEWQLDLGDVREAAKVILNGQEIADAWSLPFVVRLGDRLRPGRNRLEIEVTNLPANRVRDLDVRHENWKIMRDINLASLRYGAFEASGWTVAPSGLLGPVRLVPLEVVSPR